MKNVNFGKNDYSVNNKKSSVIENVKNFYSDLKQKISDSVSNINEEINNLNNDIGTVSNDTNAEVSTNVKNVVEENTNLSSVDSSEKVVSVSSKASSNDGNNKISYTVKSGDTLYAIAKKNGITVDELYAANKDTIGSNPNLISVGMELVIPGTETKSTENKETVAEKVVEKDESSAATDASESKLESNTTEVKETDTKAASGKKVTIPTNFKQSGICADHTQNYGTRKWASGTGQKRVRDAYVAAGSKSDGVLCTLDGRYLVAVADGKFGNVGDNIDVTLEDGSVIHCTIADVKGYDRLESGNEWGHSMGGSISLVEWEINTSLNGNNAKLNNQLDEKGWRYQDVVSITNVGASGY